LRGGNWIGGGRARERREIGNDRREGCEVTATITAAAAAAAARRRRRCRCHRRRRRRRRRKKKGRLAQGEEERRGDSGRGKVCVKPGGGEFGRKRRRRSLLNQWLLARR